MKWRAWILGGAIVIVLAAALAWPLLTRPRRILILVALPTAENPYWLEMNQAIRATAAKMADSATVEIRVGSADTDARQQIGIMRDFLLSTRVGALVLGPASATAVVPTVAEYNRRRVPVVVVDSKLDTGELAKTGAHIDAFIGSRNRQGGALAAARIREIVGSGPQVVLMVEGSPDHETAIARTGGFKDSASASWRIEEKAANWSRAQANELTRAVLTRGVPKAVFAESDEMAMGVIEALQARRVKAREWPVIVGFDATPDGLAAVAAGTMCATVAQRPDSIGREALRTAYALARGVSVAETDIGVDVTIVPEAAGTCGSATPLRSR